MQMSKRVCIEDQHMSSVMGLVPAPIQQYQEFQKVHNALNECSRKLNTSRKIDPGTLDFPGRCSRSRSDIGEVGECSLCNQRTAILVLWGRKIFNMLRFFLTKEVERGSMLLANEGELQRSTSLRLNGLLGLLTDLCAAWENGRRLKHLDSDEVFWLFESEGVTEAERIEALKAKRREYALIAFKRLRGFKSANLKSARHALDLWDCKTCNKLLYDLIIAQNRVLRDVWLLHHAPGVKPVVGPIAAKELPGVRAMGQNVFDYVSASHSFQFFH